MGNINALINRLIAGVDDLSTPYGKHKLEVEAGRVFKDQLSTPYGKHKHREAGKFRRG